MSKPTEAQIKEFWECYGIEHRTIKGEGLSHYRDGDWYYGSPKIDLNNLFKYAVPKLLYCEVQLVLRHTAGSKNKDREYIATTSSKFGNNQMWKDEDPALALFWALWQVKEKKNEMV